MQVFKEPVQFSKGVKPGERDGALPTAGAATVVLSQGSDLQVPVRRARFNVTSGAVAVADANDYGSMKLVDLPTNPIAILAVETDFVLTKDGVGYIATTDLDVAIGTAAASNTTLATTMLNVINKADLDTNALSVDMELHSASNSSPAPLVLPSGAKALYLNVSGPTETSQAASLAVNGWVDITWVDLG